ncbi:MAG TPA: 50S ribosomal protein L1 [Candidatus Saccharimonadales bacterium]|nr:50S ribosomal protein L1 [Candidatus Saccharimonadales bacterium]
MAEAKVGKKQEVKSKKVLEEKSKKTTPEEVKGAEAIQEKDVVSAKAGKRSAKAIAEVEQKQAKVERKAKSAAAEGEGGKKPKVHIKPPRSRLERRSKKYKEVAKHIDAGKRYTLQEALDLAIKTSTTKFDASVELHINLNVDPKISDQNVRGNISLPAGTGKELKVAVFTEEAPVELKKVGADIVGNDDFLAQLDREKLDFDILVTSPQMMARLAKYARVLGPRGLMPNPKSGTVTTDLAKAIKEAKAGRIEFRVDSTGIIHLGIGKVSFGIEKLVTNAETVVKAVRNAKPASLKGIYINSIFLTTTMGPSIKVSSK